MWLLQAPDHINNGVGDSSERLALGEPAERAFSAALAMGSLSPTAAAVAAKSETNKDSRTTQALSNVVEWQEWHRIVATNELREETTQPSPEGEVRYWRWNGEHLVRYRIWENEDECGEESEETEPTLVLVHGFGASCDQWVRLVKSLKNPCRQDIWAGKNGAQGGSSCSSRSPKRIVALDLLGFGHAAKPGLSYTQHLWEAQIVDFIVEVLDGAPFVIVGNSIGGGLSAGVASNLRSICRGLVLCNTAGLLLTPDEYKESLQTTSSTISDVGSKLLKGGAPTLGDVYYSPLPNFKSPLPGGFGSFAGQTLLDGFGEALIAFLRPQIPNLLKKYYPVNPDNADEKLAIAIARDAVDPGASNVIGSGQKLPPQRPLNEVIGQTGIVRHLESNVGTLQPFGGPVLVPQGMLDPLTGAELAMKRAHILGTLRPGITVDEIEAGHCPHDEVPDAVAKSIAKWWQTTVRNKESSVQKL